MALYSFITLFSLISIVASQNCNFYGSNGVYYDLSSLSLVYGQAYLYQDSTSGITWYFNICGKVQNLLDENGNSLSECPDNSAVCFTDGSKYYSGGQMGQYFTPTSDGSLVTLSYTQGDSCTDPAHTFNTDIEVYCGSYSQLTVLGVNASDSCERIIYAESSYACAASMDTSSIYYASPSVQHHDSTIFSYFWIPGLIGLIMICALIARCQQRARRRYQNQCTEKNHQIEMSNYHPMQQEPQLQQQQQFVPLQYYPAQYNPNQSFGGLPAYLSQMPQFGYPVPAYPNQVPTQVQTQVPQQSQFIPSAVPVTAQTQTE